MPLSKVLLSRMELTAMVMSAVSSISAGVLPLPTPIAGCPEEYAAFTMPGPPVASTNAIALLLISCCDSSTVGSSIQPMMPSGAPAATAASSSSRAVWTVHFFARGCGEKMIPLRVLSANSALKIVVDVGFVVGTTPAITPIGSAMRQNPFVSSRSITPQVRSSRYLLKMNSAAKWFLITLSSITPMPVSATASLANGMRALFAATVTR